MNETALTSLVCILKAFRSRRLGSLAHDFVVALDSLPDDAMRQMRLIEWLVPMADLLAVEVLERLLEGAQQDRPRYRAVVSSIMDLAPLLARLGEERVGEWRELALRERWHGVLALLTTQTPHRRYYAPHQVDVNEQLESPLGRRKSLARSFERQVLERLLYDKHPAVVGILLNNPRITERDVVKMAAMQPTTEQALHAIFVHPRWSRRYTVKKALVFNPYTSPAVAESLLTFLMRQDLQAAACTRRLARELRERAQMLLDLQRARRLSVAPEPLTSRSAAACAGEPTEEELARDFLAGLPDAELVLQALAVDEEEDEIESLAASFLEELPVGLPLLPVDEAEEGV